MKKEVVLAIAIGFALGLVITFGIWTANKSLKQANSSVSESASTSSSLTPPLSPTPMPASNLSLSISSPDDESLNTTGSITLAGKTSPQASVAIVSDLEEQIVTTDSAGNFTVTLNLEGGYNTITVSAFDAAGNSATQTLYVTYTTAKV